MTKQDRLCPRMLGYRPPRIATGLLLAAGAVQLAPPSLFVTPLAILLGGGLIAASVFCPYEEDTLERDFPEAFTPYRRRVRHWLSGFWRFQFENALVERVSFLTRDVGGDSRGVFCRQARRKFGKQAITVDRRGSRRRRT